MTLNTRKNLAVQILPAGGDNPLKLRLQMNTPVKVGSIIGLIIGALVGQGGTPGYAYSIVGGSLPTNTALNADGTIAVTGALTPGKTTFLAQVEDSTTTIFQATFEIDIDPELSVIAGDPTPFERNFAYSYTFQIDGATGTVTWSTSGSLPTGISINSSTGVLSGTPTSAAPADFNFTVTATDSGTVESIDIPCAVHLYEQLRQTGGSPQITFIVGTPKTINSTGVGFLGGAAPFRLRLNPASASIPAGVSYTVNSADGSITFLASAPFPISGFIDFDVTDALGYSHFCSGFKMIGINPIPSADAGNSITQGTDGALFASGGSSSGFPEYNFVTDFGGDPTFATDSTPAFDAIKTLMEANPGKSISVFVPDGHYKISSALRNTSAENSQILLPSFFNGTGVDQSTLVLWGAVPGATSIGLSSNTTLPTSGAVFESTLSSGAGAMMAGWSSGFANFTLLNLVLNNLTFRMPANPTNSALDLAHVVNCEIDGVTIDASAFWIDGITQPTTTTSWALRTPNVNNNTIVKLGTVIAIGYYNGFKINEHTTGSGCQSAWGCINAFVFTQAYHASQFCRLMNVWCTNGIVSDGTGQHYTTIDQYDVEHAPAGHWYTQVDDIADSSDELFGDMRWHVVLASVGIDHTFTVSGASNFTYAEMGTTSGGTSLFYREDSPYEGSALTASAGNDTLTLNQSPYASSETTLRIYKNGTRLLIGTDITFVGNVGTLATPCSGGEVFEVEYWSASSASATTISTSAGSGLYAAIIGTAGGPFAFYKLEEASGNFIDSGSGGNDLAPGSSGLTRASTSLVPSESGSACVVSTGADLIGGVAAQVIPFGTSQSASIVFVANFANPGSYFGFSKQGDNTVGGGQGDMAAVDSGGHFGFEAYDGGFHDALTSAGASASTTHLFGISVDAGSGEVRLYLDGTKVDTISSWTHGCGSSTIAGDFRLGCDFAGTPIAKFAGKMQSYAVWHSALSDGEHSTLWAAF